MRLAALLSFTLSSSVVNALGSLSYSVSVQDCCAFSPVFTRCRPSHQHGQRRATQRLSAHTSTSTATASATTDAKQITSKQRWQHPSQPEPDYITNRKHPQFPGAIPIENDDITTCINQIGQTSPANVLLGKPSECKCKHGYSQAFSLDPMPSVTDRLNSGLMKLTCPMLVNSIDVLEDDGFMKEVNSKLVDNENGMWMECFGGAHEAHAAARAKLIFDTKESNKKEVDDKMNVLRSKLGERGASSFLDAGVAGANPLASTVDVKCLHAWFADYLFRASTVETARAKDHPIGEAIAKALKGRGIDITGTETCHEVCSGCSRVSSPCGENNNMSVHVPYPTNKKRKKRPVRQLESQ